MAILSDEALEACRKPGRAIILARVRSAQIGAPGTRSEMAIIQLAVERAICGDAPAELSVWRYTSGGDTLLAQGRKYVVSCGRARGPVDYSLGEFVLVPAGKESESVEEHLAALQRLSGPGR